MSESTPEPRGYDFSGLPVGAVLASALAAANYGGDSGEDVDRLIDELAKRGYVVVPTAGLRDAEQAYIAIKAALATARNLPAASTEPALDVERLERAQVAHYEEMEYRLHVCVGGCAANIAKHYARLAESR